MAENNNDDVPSIPLPPAAAGVPPIEPAPAAPPAATAPPAPPASPVAPGVPQPLPPVAPPQPDPYAAPGAAPNPYAQPGYTAPPAGYPAYAPAAAGPVQGLSIAAMITGIAAVLLSFVSFGFLPAVAAVVLGHLAQKRQPYARPFWLTGLITGYIALGISVITGIVLIGIFIVGVTSSNYY